MWFLELPRAYYEYSPLRSFQGENNKIRELHNQIQMGDLSQVDRDEGDNEDAGLMSSERLALESKHELTLVL